MKIKNIKILIFTLICFFACSIFGLSITKQNNKNALANINEIILTEGINENLGKMTITAPSTVGETYEFWTKKEIDGAFCWVSLTNGFVTQNSITVDNFSNYLVDGHYYIMVRVKVNTANVKQYYNVFKRENVQSLITKITVDGEEILATNEVVYVRLGAKIEVATNGNLYSLYEGENKLESLILDKVGKYTYKAVSGVDERIFTLCVYDDNLDMPTIQDVTFSQVSLDGQNSTKTINVTLSKFIQDSSLTIQFGNYKKVIDLTSDTVSEIISLPTEASEGVFACYVQLKVNGKVQDGYSVRETFTPSKSTLNTFCQKNGKVYTLGASEDSNYDAYEITRFDSKGNYIIKSYNNLKTITFEPKDLSAYVFFVRGKNNGSKAMFGAEKRIVINDIVSDNNFVIEDFKAYVRTPVKVNVTEISGAIYRFIVTSKGEYDIKQYYSPVPSFLFIANKETEYKIEAQALTNGNRGYAERVAYKTFSIAKDNDTLNLINTTRHGVMSLNRNKEYLKGDSANSLKFSIANWQTEPSFILNWNKSQKVDIDIFVKSYHNAPTITLTNMWGGNITDVIPVNTWSKITILYSQLLASTNYQIGFAKPSLAGVTPDEIIYEIYFDNINFEKPLTLDEDNSSKFTAGQNVLISNNGKSEFLNGKSSTSSVKIDIQASGNSFNFVWGNYNDVTFDIYAVCNDASIAEAEKILNFCCTWGHPIAGKNFAIGSWQKITINKISANDGHGILALRNNLGNDKQYTIYIDNIIFN